MFPFVKIANENFFHTWLAEKGEEEREGERKGIVWIAEG